LFEILRKKSPFIYIYIYIYIERERERERERRETALGKATRGFRGCFYLKCRGMFATCERGAEMWHLVSFLETRLKAYEVHLSCVCVGS
jgi:hypothetical protein